MEKKIKKVAEDFQNFAFKDAILGTAVGIMLGAAIKDLINSLIDNILMPPIAYLTSGLDFSELFLVIGKSRYESVDMAREAGALIITYGEFINSLITFLILALVLYFLFDLGVKSLQKRFKDEEKKKPNTKVCPYCKTDIPIKATRCPNCTSKLEE
jgi:large conductance mechanosensitive channel